jgi:hypothetical protein
MCCEAEVGKRHAVRDASRRVRSNTPPLFLACCCERAIAPLRQADALAAAGSRQREA